MLTSRIKPLRSVVRMLLVMIIASAATTTQAAAGQQKAAGLAIKNYLPSIGKGPAEWTFHKTADGQHPNGDEQQMMWLMNRARSNPAKEGIWLATTTDPTILSPRNYFNVNLGVLQSEFARYGAMPPAAFDVRLYNAAKAHSDYLIATNAQNHDGQFARVNATGYLYTTMRGNVFSYAASALNAHAAFNIDWGTGTTDGMQAGRGHRQAIMSLDNDYYSNVGLAVVAENNPATGVGPFVVTGNYAHPNTSAANQYHRFIVGTVWQDRNRNGQYDPGEGYSNVTVKLDSGAYYAVTANAGGYAIPVLTPGIYTVRFSGSVSGAQQVAVGTCSVLVDLQVPYSGSAPAADPAATSPSFGEPVAPPPGISQ